MKQSFSRPNVSLSPSADLQSAVSQNCILRAADSSNALERRDTLPITIRRYSRVQLCATIPFICLLAAFSFGVSSYGAEAPSLTGPSLILTNAAQVRALTVKQSERRHPVRLRGKVTYADLTWGMLFIQDSTDGIYVMHSDVKSQLEPGQEVDVAGLTHPGSYTPVVTDARVTSRTKGALPPARRVSFPELAEDKEDGHWIEVRGVVKSTRMEGRHLILHLREGTDWLNAIIPVDPSAAIVDLRNATVRVQGVCAVEADENRRILRSQLFVPNLAYVFVDEMETKDRFDLPVLSISHVPPAAQSEGQPNRVRVQGVVVTNQPNLGVIIEDATGRACIEGVRTNDLRLGLRVDVVGTPALRAGEILLRESILRRIGVNSVNGNSHRRVDSAPGSLGGDSLLRSIQRVRALKPSEAELGRPVRVQCVVTYYDRDWGTLFVQDSTAGIYVDSGGYRFDLEPGQWIELEGSTAPGNYAPVIAEPRFQILGQAAMPACHPFALNQLNSGMQDSQWIEVEGVVHSAQLDNRHVTLSVTEGGDRFDVLIPNSRDLPGPNYLVDAKARFRGVCGTLFNQRRQLMGIRLFVPGPEFITIKRQAPANAFTLPVTPINSLLRFTASDNSEHRVRVTGIVTLCRPGQFLFIQDATGGLMAKTRQGDSLLPGDRVDLAGFPTTGRYTPVLAEAIFRKTGTGPAPEPTAATAAQALSANFDHDIYDAKLIRIQGEVLEVSTRPAEGLLVLKQGSHVFNATLGGTNDVSRFPPGVKAGSIVELAGACEVQVDASLNPNGFQIYLRSPKDIAILQSAPWWTARHTLWLLTCVGAVLSLSLAWAASLRRQVRQRTRQLHEEIEQHECTEANLEAEIAERKRMEIEVGKTHQELLAASRQAGMAEVATGVLHNVGNVLNSVNVSATIIADQLKSSKVSGLGKAVALMQEHAADLGAFIAADPRGKQLPIYLGQLTEHLGAEQDTQLKELELLRKNIEHIKDIVAVQQSYATVSGVTETVDLSGLVDDALRMNAGSLERHDVQVVRNYQDLEPIQVDKHKVLQILVNLIRNAKFACDESNAKNKEIRLRLARNGDGRIKIEVKDNGVGIPKENLTRIFAHGFTTRRQGHGFGLHSGALAAKEMGGKLHVHSDGPGLGATFTLELPLNPSVRNMTRSELAHIGEST
jgi:signal transduction histidine kinase